MDVGIDMDYVRDWILDLIEESKLEEHEFSFCKYAHMGVELMEKQTKIQIGIFCLNTREQHGKMIFLMCCMSRSAE